MAKAKTAKPTRERGREIFRRAFPQARSMWQAGIPNVGEFEAFLLGDQIVIVQEYSNGDGWNVFGAVTKSGRIDETIAAVAAFCGGVEINV
jgi:hypothetical protein